MVLLKAMRLTRGRVAVLLAGCLLMASLVFAFASSTAKNSSFYRECIGQFSESERENGPQPIKEKIAGVEQECRHLAAIHESVSEAQVQAAKETWRTTHPVEALSPASEPTIEAGIIDSRESPAERKETFETNNHWLGQVNGQWYLVFAGMRTPPQDGPAGEPGTEQAEVLVYLTPSNANSREPNTFVGGYNPPSEAQRGSLTITEANGSVLTLTTSTEETLSFDVATRTFG